MKYEIKKLTTSKFFIILLICLMTNVFLCYTDIPNLPASKAEINYYIDLYENDYESFEEKYKNYNFIDGLHDSFLPADAYAMKTIAEQAIYIARYHEDLAAILFQAKVNMSELDPNTYMYRYQNQILDIYPTFAEQPLKVSQIRGWDFYFEYLAQNIISGIFIILAAILLFITEEECSMTPINQTCPKGRFHLSVQKSLVILIFSAAIVVLQTVVTLLCIQIKIGLVGYALPIQLLAPYEFAPFDMSIGAFSAFQIIFKICGVFLLGLLTAVITKLTRTQIFSFAFSILFVAAEYKIVPDETLQNTWGRYANLYQLICANDIFKRYFTFNLFGYSVDAIFVLICLILLCCAVLFLALFFLCRRVGSKHHLTLNIKNNFKGFPQKITLPASYLFFEIKKLNAKKWTLLLAVGLIGLKCFYTFDSISNINDMVYRNYITQFEGSYSAEKNIEIQNIRFEIDDILQKKEQIAAAYREGKIDEIAYENFMEQYWDSYIMDREFEKVEGQNKYLKELQLQGTKGWFLYDTGYAFLFQESADWFCCLFLLILTYWLFLDEDHTKMTQIIKTTQNGRKSFFFQKIKFALFIGILSCILFSAIDFIMISSYIPSFTLHAPAISLQMFENIQSGITIFQMYVICFILKLMMFSFLAVLFASLGLYFKRFVSIVVVILLILFVPSVIGNNIKIFQYLDVTAFLSGSHAVILSLNSSFFWGWGILAIQLCLYGVLFVFFITYSNKKWCYPL